MRLLLVIFILIFSFGVNAQKVSFQEAQLVAENWSAMKMGRVGKNSLANEKSKLATNHAFYIFNLDDDGFVLVSLSNVTIAGNGQDGGRAVAKAANSVTISSDFEVQLGAQFSIYVEPCGN